MKIFLVKFDSFHGNYYAICTRIEQYSFEKNNELFTYHDHIMVNRKVTRKEAEQLLELIKHNGSGKVCGGKTMETTELV